MSASNIFDFFPKKSFQKIFDTIENEPFVHLKGLSGSSSSLIASMFFQQKKRLSVFILDDKETAAYFLNDLENLVGQKYVLFFPSSYKAIHNRDQTDNMNIVLRAEVLNKLIEHAPSGSPVLIVTYAEALCEKVVTKKELSQNTIHIRVGERISIDDLTNFLFDLSFERKGFVYEPGQFSVRGGIIDVFSFSNEQPYRLEFLDDEIESIRSFDPSTQLSIQKYSQIDLTPNTNEKTLFEKRESFFEYIPKESAIWCNDILHIKEVIQIEYEKSDKEFSNSTSVIKQLSPAETAINGETFIEQLQQFKTVEFGKKFYFNSLPSPLHSSPQPPFHKNFNLLAENISANVKEGYQNIILAGNEKQADRIRKIFQDINPELSFGIVQLTLHEGFIDHDNKIACYTDHQIFDRYHRFRLKDGYKTHEALTLKELQGLHPGDFVTHIDHGVGRFDGLETLNISGKPQEAIRLIYKDSDILYVSIHSLHRISKYSGQEGIAPKLSKLGSTAWAILKQKTKSKVKDIAKDLIKLYAERKSMQGFAFAPDTYLQHELEASFIYEDTPDQHKATLDVKKDMESSHPMDRLVCGDVGFGKTEIAIRAAFKAVTDSKQVGVLVPTTILALQHYQTFSERLKDFPCKIDYLNRFKSSKEQKAALQKLESGEIDIIIGTHRMLSADVKFKDLGLLIVDEEQKFGVTAKEKLKSLKVNVDTLTLTATPIPRTLQFSMLGARDLSIINTPPPNRFPVETQLHIFKEEILRDAMYYEISRGGQVFFVHNRIQNLKEIAGLVKRLCPEVKIATAHGQMDGKELESIMLDFIEGNYDILVSTAIVESGLDIPNANTIIINNAHQFGLSDLHQLRGRVGRSNKKAFCYLLSPPVSTLTAEARKRLKTIEEFSELGSGFNIAMRDMDIRGAGNLLGGEQSGFINEVGFETYHKILDEAIAELKETEYKDLFKEPLSEKKDFVTDCQIDTNMEILIPNHYVQASAERLQLYQEIDDIENEEKLKEYELKLTDRFGQLPESVKELLNIVRLRWTAKKLGIEKLILKSGKMICYFVSNPESEYYQSEIFNKILQYIQKNQRKCKMKEANSKLSLTFELIKDTNDAFQILADIK
jgi:transcription-repair coupling factor (superfamily II helicase)